MANGKNCFIQTVKLPHVRGRVRYISDPKRQENLYATYSNVDPKFWRYLSKENQADFIRSGTKGKCIEARELIIMLPPSLIGYDHDILLKYFTAKFVEKYDVAVASALHHNKRKTNLHIHLIFSERQAFEMPEEKIASRNMFYDENGKHVRTKKEILDESGEIRPGCKIVKKGEVYEKHYFKPKNPEFKSKKFTEDMKYFYTEIINDLVKDPAEKLKVFDKNSPYLPTRKIGKNNPKEKEIRIDNYLRQEWNNMVDRAVVEGVTEEELCITKKTDIVDPVVKSIRSEGWKPDLFRKILQTAIGKLRGFIQYIKETRNAEFDENGNPLLSHDLRIDVTSEPLPPIAGGERTSSEIQEAEVMKLDNILRKMKKTEQRIYAIEQAKIKLEKELKEVQKKWFHGKEKKELEQKISGKQRELSKSKDTLSQIPRMNGYENALEVKKAYKSAKRELDKVRKQQNAWDQAMKPSEKMYLVIRANRPEQTKSRSVHERLEEKKREAAQQQRKERKWNHNRDCL